VGSNPTSSASATSAFGEFTTAGPRRVRTRFAPAATRVCSSRSARASSSEESCRAEWPMLVLGPGPVACSGPQLTAFFTSAPILASSAAVNSVNAKEVGHMVPSSRFASALKPNVAYRSLNFDAGVKKQRTLPPLA
jgi:hypothetical protein